MYLCMYRVWYTEFYERDKSQNYFHPRARKENENMNLFFTHKY